MKKKIYVQLTYNDITNECYWTIKDRKKTYGGIVKPNEYQNYLCEKLVAKCGYNVVHGSLDMVGEVNDLSNKVRYRTYTVMAN